jgi:Polysaccharide biosynthesis protein.
MAMTTADSETVKEVLIKCHKMHCALKRFGTIDDVNEQTLANAHISDINLEDLLRRDSIQLNMKVVKGFIEGKTVLVTGGAGSIGSEICRQVLSFGAKKLIIFDIHENGLFDIQNELKEKYDKSRFLIKLGSIRDRNRVNEIFDEFRPQVVFHAAAHKHVPMMEFNPSEAVKNNVFGTINVAQAAILYKAEKFILISTDKAVNPANIMGATKRIAEMTIQLFNRMSETDLAAVRFGNVLGSSGSVVPFFKKQIEKGGPVTVTHPEMRRYFMTIPEAVQLVLEAGAMAKGGEIFVLDMGKPVLIYDLACDLIRLSGYEPEKDIKIEFTGLRPGEKLFEEISLAEEDVVKTPNNKIYICKPVEYNERELSELIKQLEDRINKGDEQGMFSCVSRLVPTFKYNKEKI